MAKYIKINDEDKREILRAALVEMQKALSGKSADGKFTFTRNIGSVDAKANVYFTMEAWHKMNALVKEFYTEVAWHATAYRMPTAEGEETHDYLIGDIVVYPQTVTGATVDMDTAAYSLWLAQNDDDERFQNLFCQGHSHVNMGVTPSAVDLTHQEEILEQLGPDDFYIFMIWNKSGSANIRIYDLQKNIQFDNADIKHYVIGMGGFIEGAKEMVKRNTPSTGASGYGRSPVYTPGYGTHTGPYNPNQLPSGSGDTNTGKGGGKKNKDKKDKKRTKVDGSGSAGAAQNPAGSSGDAELIVVGDNGEPFDVADPFGYLENCNFQIT